MKKRILIPFLTLSALLAGSLALAGPGGYGKGGGCNGHGPGAMDSGQHEERVEQKLEIMTTVLELTEEQQTGIKSLIEQRHQEKQQLREQMRASRDAMREARNAVPFNEADFRAKVAAHADLKADMMVEHVKLKQQIHALLTPEQQKKADTLGGMMGGHGKGRKHGRNGF
jgi:protein CpxP